MELDFSNMTLNEYLMYQRRHKDLERSFTSRKSVAPARNRILVYPDYDEEDEECDDITNYVDYDQEDGELPDLPTFFVTNEFSSVCEQGEENIDVNTTQEL
ncbi:hypothetical protein Tco_0317622 [Tanacetum coccineum]